jgi:rubrerythrin
MQELKNKVGSNQQSVTPTQNAQQTQKDLKGTQYETENLNPEDLGDRWLRWKCLKCGFVYEGQKPLNVCPKCGNDDPDLFDDAF